MMPTWGKVTLGFLFGAGIGVGVTYLVCNTYYTNRENESVESVKKTFKEYFVKKDTQKIDIPKEEPKKENYAADADAYSSLTEVYTAPAKKPKKYNKRDNEEVGMDQVKLPTVHVISADEFADNESCGKVSLMYFAKDRTLVDEYGNTLWRDGKNADPECHFEWFSQFVDSLTQEDHIYIFDPNKDTAYQISNVNGRRSDFYVEEEED